MSGDILRQRSDLLRRAREFFYDRGFLEVATPLLATEVIPERHIEPVRVDRGGYLQASPELFMKRLLASQLQSAEIERIFQITRSFRAGEQGAMHRPEFTIVEWYRTGDDMERGTQLLDDFCQEMLNAPPAMRMSYGEAFEQAVGVDPHRCKQSALERAARELQEAAPPPAQAGSHERELWLDWLWSKRVENSLPTDVPVIVHHYPACQAALARLTEDAHGNTVAERFELFYRGVELANGYHELTDATELRARLKNVNALRDVDGRSTLPLPESLLAAIEQGLPACSGCAVGFDRLLMLACGVTTIDEVMQT